MPIVKKPRNHEKKKLGTSKNRQINFLPDLVTFTAPLGG